MINLIQEALLFIKEDPFDPSKDWELLHTNTDYKIFENKSVGIKVEFYNNMLEFPLSQLKKEAHGIRDVLEAAYSPKVSIKSVKNKETRTSMIFYYSFNKLPKSRMNIIFVTGKLDEMLEMHREENEDYD